MYYRVSSVRKCRICKGYLREGSKPCDTPTEDGPAASLRTVKGHMTAKNTKPKASCVTKSQKNVHFEMPPHVDQPTTQTDAFRNNIHCWGSATLPPDEDVALRSGKKPARQGMVKLHGLTPNVAMHLTSANNFAQDHLAECLPANGRSDLSKSFRGHAIKRRACVVFACLHFRSRTCAWACKSAANTNMASLTLCRARNLQKLVKDLCTDAKLHVYNL